MSSFLTLTPAYGRDYKSKAAVLADWEANKDFRIATFGAHDGQYINKRDAGTLPNTTFQIRYKALAHICQVSE